MNSKVARPLRWALTAAIVIFLVIFARTIDWTSAWRSIRGASLPLLAAAMAVNFISIAVKGVRWWLFLRPAGIPSLGLALRATIAGCGLNNVLVANGGDAARVVFVSRATRVPSSTILATVALERLFDPVGFVILLVWGAIVYELPPSLERWALPAQIALALIIGRLAWLVYASRHTTELPPEARKVATGIRARLKAYVGGFAASTKSLTSGRRFLGALAISLISWAGQVATFQLAAAAANVDIPAAGIFAALLATNLGLILRATPGNVGFFQVAFALSVAPFGVERNAAIAVSLLIQTIQILPITPVGIALAPEFIFSRRSRRAKVDERDDAAALGSVPQEGEELAGAARKT